MYDEIKVYDSVISRSAYLCRGVAVDNSFCWDPSMKKQKSIPPHESRLLYTKRQRQELGTAIQNGDLIRIYRYVVVHNGAKKKSSWFITEEDALGSPLAKKHPQDCENGEAIRSWLQCWWLDTRSIKPVEFPITVKLEPADDGRPYTRINLHPEIDGIAAAGVMCFPDRGMHSCIGHAVVTGVKDKGTYAFLMGHMIQYGMPDMRKFLDYAWNHLCSDMQTPLYVVNHPVLGKLLCSDEYVWVETATSPYCKGMPDQLVPYQKVKWTEPADLMQHVVEKTSLEKLILKDAFGTEAEPLLAKFTGCKGIKHSYNERWIASGKLMPEIIEQAIAEGLIAAYSLPSYNIHALVLDRTAKYRLAAFTWDEIDEMAAEYSRNNALADEMITAKLRKGKLRLQMAA